MEKAGPDGLKVKERPWRLATTLHVLNFQLPVKSAFYIPKTNVTITTL